MVSFCHGVNQPVGAMTKLGCQNGAVTWVECSGVPFSRAGCLGAARQKKTPGEGTLSAFVCPILPLWPQPRQSEKAESGPAVAALPSPFNFDETRWRGKKAESWHR